MLDALTLLTLLSLNGNVEASVTPQPSLRAKVLTVGAELDALLAPPRDNTEESGSEILDALRDGKVWLKLRYRFENASQNGVAKEAYASTLRTVLGYETGSWNNFSGLVEFEDVSPIIDDSFNSTDNGKINRATVADPDLTEVNQVHLKYKMKDQGAFRVGRQRITLGNHRWVGNVGWRQNEQTFDGATGEYKYGCGLDLFYGYITNQNRIFGDDQRMNSHLLQASKELGDSGELSVYAFHLDFDLPAGNEPSTTTVGSRFAGSVPVGERGAITYAAEYAHQEEAGNNQDNVNADYFLGEAGWKADCGSAKLGYEVLGSNGMNNSVQAPLATLHKFNGWADKFLTTPGEGLVDMYVALQTKVGEKTTLKAIYHDFESDSQSIDFGKEYDFDAYYAYSDKIGFGARYANYMASNNGAFNLTDTNKWWFWVSFIM